MIEVMDLALYAPIPVGHRVSVVPIESYVTPLFGGKASWQVLGTPLVCDEDTRIIYADRNVGLSPETTYEQICFKSQETRVSQSKPPVRGVVLACLALYDYGDSVHMHTILRIETGPRLS